MAEFIEVNKEEKPEPLKELIWTIKFSLETGGINVDGPINDELLTLGILEKTKDLVKAHNLRRVIDSQPKIIKHGVMDFMRNKH